MLDDVRRVADDARGERLAGRQVDVLPDAPLVLVARVGVLVEVGAGVDLEHELQDVAQRDVVGVRSVPAAPADVVADLVLRNPLERVVERGDARLGPRPVVVHRAGGHEDVVHERDVGVVDLEVEPRVDDRPVLLGQGVGDAEQRGLLGSVVLVDEARKAGGGRDDGQEALLRPGGLHGRLEVGDVARDDLAADVGHGRDAGPVPARALVLLLVREVVGVELGEARPVGGRVVDAGEVRVARRARAQLDAAEALVDVVVPGRLAELAIADDVDAGVALRLDDVADRPRQALLVGLRVVVVAGVDLAQVRHQLCGRTRLPTCVVRMGASGSVMSPPRASGGMCTFCRSAGSQRGPMCSVRLTASAVAPSRRVRTTRAG